MENSSNSESWTGLWSIPAAKSIVRYGMAISTIVIRTVSDYVLYALVAFSWK